MEEILAILAAIAAFFFVVTFHAVVFVFLLLMAIFSPRYRKKLRDHWDTSIWQRLGIILGVSMYSVALIIALLFWTPMFGDRSNDTAENDTKPGTTIEFTDEEVQRIKKTKEIDELVDVAGSIIKRKQSERKEEAEQGGDGDAE